MDGSPRGGCGTKGKLSQSLMQRQWNRGFAGVRGREYTKANAAASKTTASNQRARAGGEMEVPAAANGAVVAALWEEAAKEHGSDVLVVGGWDSCLNT